eukprot:m.298296 g.298296  ORF g.298296 m.298296 type:complete len:141 (-) comp55174_c0_seq24:1544-1966(-)
MHSASVFRRQPHLRHLRKVWSTRLPQGLSSFLARKQARHLAVMEETHGMVCYCQGRESCDHHSTPENCSVCLGFQRLHCPSANTGQKLPKMWYDPTRDCLWMPDETRTKMSDVLSISYDISFRFCFVAMEMTILLRFVFT